MEGLAALSLDALSSVAYGPEAIVLVLAAAGTAALRLTLPVTLAIAGLLAVLVVSYCQVIAVHPGGGDALPGPCWPRCAKPRPELAGVTGTVDSLCHPGILVPTATSGRTAITVFSSPQQPGARSLPRPHQHAVRWNSKRQLMVPCRWRGDTVVEWTRSWPVPAYCPARDPVQGPLPRLGLDSGGGLSAGRYPWVLERYLSKRCPGCRVGTGRAVRII